MRRLALSSLACFVLSCIALAAPTITLSKKIGPPTSEILIYGNGFKPRSPVAIYFDSKNQTLVFTNNEGEFQHAVIHAPREAKPGRHWVTALERGYDERVQKPFVVFTNWPDYRFSNERRGFNPYENVLSVSNITGLALRWKFSTKSNVFSDPVIVDGVLYAGSGDGNLYALNAYDGALLWKLAIPSYDASPPTIVKGVIYVGSCDNNLYAIDAKTQRILWKYQAGGCVWTSPAVVNGVVYFGADNVYALDAATGTLLWEQTSSLYIFSSPAVANGIVCYGSGGYETEGFITALDALTGKLLWSHNSGIYPGSIEGSPAIAGGAVYVGSEDDYFYAFDLKTGRLLWKYSLGGPSLSASTAYDDVYDTSLGTLFAFNADSGKFLWEYGPPGVLYEPVIANGVVYLGSSNEYHQFYALAFDAETGTMLWQYPIQAYIPTMMVDNGLLYVAGSELYVFGIPGTQANSYP